MPAAHLEAMTTTSETQATATVLGSGRIVGAEFSDGKLHPDLDCAACGCDCGCHEDEPRPEGTYLLVRMDTDVAVSFSRVKVVEID